MQERTNLIDEGIDAAQSAYRSMEEELQKFRKRAETEARRLQKEFKKNPVMKRVDSFQSDMSKQIGSNVEGLLGRLSLASQGDLKRIDRKLNQLARKLKALERAGTETDTTVS